MQYNIPDIDTDIDHAMTHAQDAVYRASSHPIPRSLTTVNPNHPAPKQSSSALERLILHVGASVPE